MKTNNIYFNEETTWAQKQPIQKQIRMSTCFDGFHTYIQGETYDYFLYFVL